MNDGRDGDARNRGHEGTVPDGFDKTCIDHLRRRLDVALLLLLLMWQLLLITLAMARIS